MSENNAINGGEFLIRETSPNDIFIPEEFNEEQRMISQTCRDFVEQEIFPILDRIDSMEEGSSFIDNADKYDKIHNLEMQLKGIKPMNTEVDCIGCGS